MLGRFVEIHIQEAECPRDRWDMSRGQTGHKPGGVPPKFCMFIGFFFPQLKHDYKSILCPFTGIVHICGLLGPFVKGVLVAKL